jgi:hypothetical protein
LKRRASHDDILESRIARVFERAEPTTHIRRRKIKHACGHRGVFRCLIDLGAVAKVETL